MTEILLSFKEVCASVGLGKSWIYAAIQRGDFPAQIYLTPSKRRCAFRASEIEAWKMARVEESITARAAR